MDKRNTQKYELGECFAHAVSDFREFDLSRPSTVAGYAWLVDRYELRVPMRPRLAALSGKHRPREVPGWIALPERYRPAEDVGAQLTFALKWEGVDLTVLDALFASVSPDVIAADIRRTPSGAYKRRLWFLYEWLTGRELDLPPAQKLKAVDVVDPKLQIALKDGVFSSRHRVRDNLPGTRLFCPMVRRSAKIAAAQALGLGDVARAVIGRTSADVVSRAAAFLLLSDSRASYRIEGETPSPERAIRWGQAIARAGKDTLSPETFEALQRLVISDGRFVHLGLRKDGGFVGEHDRDTGHPLPEHISARSADLDDLMEGLVAYDERAAKGGMDPVAAAAAEAFGFVYIHPFEDGNGRVHRWLIHHVLAKTGFAPGAVVFPVSAVMLREIDEYRRVLESYSKPLLPLIAWRPTAENNVEVLNDTASWYRYFDATAHTEFLYDCVRVTVQQDLPYEVAYLESYDRFCERVSALVDMPSRTVDMLHRFLRQNDGRLSIRARQHEFEKLTSDEVAKIERVYAECVAGSASAVRRATNIAGG